MIAAIVVAAGEGRRLKQSLAAKQAEPKQFIPLGGRPVIIYSLEALEKSDLVEKVVIVTNRQKVGLCQSFADQYSLRKNTNVVEGGVKRQDSVSRGLELLSPHTKTVIVHDGVRPFITPEMIERACQSMAEFDGVVVGMPVTETLKVVFKDSVAQTLQRQNIWSVQTPQVFRYEILLEAHARAREDHFYGTDDASLVERMGGKVRMIKGSSENIKITTSTDLLLAEAILKNRKLKTEKLET